MRNVVDSIAFWAARENYLAVNQDAAAPAYYGFESPNGEWYIMKEAISGDVTTYSYTKGASSYAANWTDRASLTYAAPSTTFA